MANIAIARVVAARIKDGFMDKYMSMFNIPFDQKELTPEVVLNYLNSPANCAKVVYEDTKIHLETASPLDDTPQATLKWVAPMEEIRGYVQEFDPVCPYDEKNDEFIETKRAEKLEVESGAVVYSKRAKTKQLHFLYNCVRNFCDSLEGSVLVIGDNGGAIAYRTGFRHTYTMYRGEVDFTVLNASVNRNQIVQPDEFPSLLEKRNFDHVVVFLYSYPWRFPQTQKVHYLTFLPGSTFIRATDVAGEFSVAGKLTSLHPAPRGNLVCHTSLFEAHDPNDFFVAWYTDLFPKVSSSSLTPLSDIVRLGPVSKVFVSDKTDGETCYLEVKSDVIVIRDGDQKVIMRGVTKMIPDQLLVLERCSERDFVVVEPLFISGLSTFGSYLALKPRIRLPFLRYKEWFPFPTDGRWERFASSGEGIVLKSMSSIIGSRDYAYRKLTTYYLKLRHRASYEDLVFANHSRDGKESILRGHHNIYKDPNKIYVGEGIYEVLVNSLELYRHRPAKKFADNLAYVQAVSSEITFATVFSSTFSVVTCVDKDTMGLISLRNVVPFPVPKNLVIDVTMGTIIVNATFDLECLLLYDSKYYKVVGSASGKSVANLMT